MKLILVIFCSVLSFGLQGQDKRITVSGVVLDSASQQPLPYTTIQLKRKNEGQSTKEDGSFSIECAKTDTLIFSRLGHKPVVLPARSAEALGAIFLAEDTQMLKEVTIYDHLNIPGMNDWKKELPSNTKIKLEDQPLEPKQKTVATFGPGVIYKLNTKDKTTIKRDDLEKTEVYRTTINSTDVKQELMNLYQLSEDAYYQKLERFNKAHPEAAYLTRKDEIVTLLIQFFAVK